MKILYSFKVYGGGGALALAAHGLNILYNLFNKCIKGKFFKWLYDFLIDPLKFVLVLLFQINLT